MTTPTISTRLNIPYGGKPHEARGFTLTVNDGIITTTLNIPLADAMALLRDLANGVKQYRESSLREFGDTIDEVVKNATI